MFIKVRAKERMTGVEPASTAWEAVVLPMNYIRTSSHNSIVLQKCKIYNITRASANLFACIVQSLGYCSTTPSQ